MFQQQSDIQHEIGTFILFCAAVLCARLYLSHPHLIIDDNDIIGIYHLDWVQNDYYVNVRGLYYCHIEQSIFV